LPRRFFDAVLRKYLSPEILAEVCEKIDDAPSAFDVWFPYIEPPKEGEEDPALRKKRERLSS
jgi:hypothetical protein